MDFFFWGGGTYIVVIFFEHLIQLFFLTLFRTYKNGRKTRPRRFSFKNRTKYGKDVKKEIIKAKFGLRALLVF